MQNSRIAVRALMFGAAVLLYSAAGMVLAAHGAEMPKPTAGKTVHFPDGTWSGVPQTGPNGKVRQCVMIPARPRAGSDGEIDTALSVDISAGAGLVFGVSDDKLPAKAVLDDEAEVILDGKSFPAVAFTIAGTSNKLAFHPGDAAGVLAALKNTGTVQLRADSGDVDTGPIALALHGDAYGWLKQCGAQFKIAIDKPTDPDAPDLPVPRPRSPEIGSAQPTAAGPPGIEDKQKISGWDASELRGFDGKVAVCMIRQHYRADTHAIATFLMVSRAKGLTMMVKDSVLNLPEGKPVDAALKLNGKPFTSFSAQVLGSDEIGIFPEHGAAFVVALGDGASAHFDAPKIETIDFPVVSGVMPWLRACSLRWGISFEPAEMAKIDQGLIPAPAGGSPR
jgi:hypothetical protein